MEAPEKIWIDPSMDLPKLNGVIDKESVQYVRRDVFIEKLCTWIKENSEMYIECEDHFYAGWLTEDFYKELRKAMEE